MTLKSDDEAEFAAACEQMRQCFAVDSRRPCEAGYRGYDWFQLSTEEEFVFELLLEDMPKLTTAQHYYDALHGGSPPPSFEDRHLMACIMRGLNIQEGTIDPDEFENFAKVLGIPYRKSHAWYNKHDAWVARQGITRFSDE